MVHPIVEQMSPSEEQKPALHARGRDVVVTAGAGTGKTRTLVARYLALLAEDPHLRSIIAITFTNKAAREMRNRIRDTIRRYLERPDLPDEERRLWEGHYTLLDAARIDTIHGLCGEILRAHPAEAAVDPRFEVLDEATTGILRKQTVDEALAWAADNADAVGLFALLGEMGLRSALNTLLGKRLDVASALARLPDDVLAHWRRVLAEWQGAVLTALLGSEVWREAVATLQENMATDPGDKIEMQRLEALAALAGAVGPLEAQLASLSRLANIKLTGGGGGAWPGGQGQVADVKAALSTLRDLWKEQAGLLGLTLTPLDEALAQLMPALRDLFMFACERYDAYKRERNALDFDDLEDGALRLLGRDPAVCDRWQREAQAILVDEFQDTNGRQRDLVRLLNGDAGKLFIVGDAKQSIYRFRGADVTVFRAERGRVEAQGGLVCTLATSYRAHRELIQGLNDLLRPLLGEAADPARPWAEPFASLLPHREEACPGFTAPHIEMHLTVGSKTGDRALDRAADALVARLVALVGTSQAQWIENDVARPLGYGDIAILCRASTSFAAYEDALERAGVPFLTVAGRGFYNRPEIRDLLNGLQSLSDPTDDLALVGLLRSPAIALSDAALYLLRRTLERSNGPLWDILRPGTPNPSPIRRGEIPPFPRKDGGQGVRFDLPAEDAARARRAAEIIADLHGRVGRTPVADLLKAFLDRTDYRAALIRAGQSRAARNVSKLLADAHASGIVGVGEFLEYVRNLRDTGAKEGEARATAEGAVQIMSVHVAKGLEFPVVVLGDMAHAARGSSGVLVDPDLGVLLPKKDEEGTASAIYRLGKLRADDQEDAESDRLLYVAATRAQEKLIFSGHVRLSKEATVGKPGGWLGRVCGPQVLGLEGVCLAYHEDGAEAIRQDVQVGQTRVACTFYEPGCTWEAYASAAQGEPRRSVTMPPPLLEAVGTPPPDRGSGQARVWRMVPRAGQRRASAWVIGKLVHEALALWRFLDDGFARWAEARARSYGLTDAHQLDDAVRESQRMLHRFQAHPLFREMDTAERRLHEVPYNLEVDGRIDNGVIDVLYLRGGVWTVVEFKTDEVREPAELDRLLDEAGYRDQAGRYLMATEQLLGVQPRFLWCMLNYDRNVLLREYG